MIPIVLLHHNDYDFLYRTINSIKLNTIAPYKLIVVDNCSTKNDSFWLKIKQNYPGIHIIFNKKNNWVYGFNLAKPFLEGHKYFVLSDADIEFPSPKKKVCWLAYLIKQLETYAPIGKAGLPLDLDTIKEDKNLSNLYNRELSFKSGKMIGSNIIAPVDTTVAIYRSDIFMENFYMRVGHFTNIKPKYYCVRVSEEFKCKHIGWEKYQSGKIKNKKNDNAIILKAKFFGRYAIMMERDLLKQLSFYYKTKYFITFYFFRTFFSLRILINIVIYILSLKFLTDNANKYDNS